MPVLLCLVFTIAIIIFLILKLRANPAVALFAGALFMGISSGLGGVETVNTITGGFGSTMASLGFSVGFGVMMGQMIAATGAVQTVANTLVKIFSKKKSDYALGVTGFIVSIPVFYDVGYVVLMPLAKTLSKKGDKTIPYFAGALVAGLGIAHTFIPPTPGPMTGAELMGIDLGVMILWGIIVGLPSFLLTIFVYDKFFLGRPSFFTVEKDVEVDEEYEKNQRLMEKELIKEEKDLPPFGLAVIPIVLPIVLILIGTVASAMGGEDVPEWIAFISNKSIAMLAGLISAILIALRNMNLKEIEAETSKSLSAIGTVLFITGTGAALGSVIQATAVGDELLNMVSAVNLNPIIFAWLIASLLKIAQGSGTVAMITTVGLMAPLLPSLDVNPVFLALASFSGTLCGAHVNDSAFWITAKMTNLNMSGGFKVYTIPCFLESIFSLAFILILSFIF